jgi:hypothetical protein
MSPLGHVNECLPPLKAASPEVIERAVESIERQAIKTNDIVANDDIFRTDE